METLRSPEDRFADIPDFDYQPHYCEVDGDESGQLRTACIEAGPAHADPVLMLHGAGHFIQEDAGEDLAGRIVDFLR